jgi:TolA-binding protein
MQGQQQQGQQQQGQMQQHQMQQNQMQQMNQMQPQQNQMQPQQNQMQQMGGLILGPDPMTIPAGNPGGAPVIAVDTSMDAMMREGLDMMGSRPIRRRFTGGQMGGYQMGGYQMGGNQMGGNQMGPPSAPTGSSNSIGQLTVTKLE